MEKCKATIEFGDDYGDNTSTFHCQLEKGHEGNHKEVGDMGDEEYPIPYILTWLGSSAEQEEIWQKQLEDRQNKCEHKNISGEGEYKWCNDCGKEFTEGG